MVSYTYFYVTTLISLSLLTWFKSLSHFIAFPDRIRWRVDIRNKYSMVYCTPNSGVCSFKKYSSGLTILGVPGMKEWTGHSICPQSEVLQCLYIVTEVYLKRSQRLHFHWPPGKLAPWFHLGIQTDSSSHTASRCWGLCWLTWDLTLVPMLAMQVMTPCLRS